MKAVFPHPLLTLSLTFVWLLLTSFTLAHLLLGFAIATAAGVFMARLHMPRPRIRNWRKLARLTLIVAWDIIQSNIAVVRIILAGPETAQRNSGFMEMELKLRDRNALALLAIILTATPGTAWLEYDPQTGRLLLHVLDLKDPEEWRSIIRNRYEALLMEIFE